MRDDNDWLTTFYGPCRKERPYDVASRFPSGPSFYPSFLRVLSLPHTSSPSHTVLSLPRTPTWFFNQQPATPIFLIPTAVFLPFLLHFFTSPERNH